MAWRRAASWFGVAEGSAAWRWVGGNVDALRSARLCDGGGGGRGSAEGYDVASIFFGAQCVGTSDAASKSAIVVCESAIATPSPRIEPKNARTVTAAEPALRFVGDDDRSDSAKQPQVPPLVV